MSLFENTSLGNELFDFSESPKSNETEEMEPGRQFPEIDLLSDNFESSSSYNGNAYFPNLNNADSSAFDPDEIEGVSKWYSEQSQLIHKHYESNLEYQKKKFDKENEAGLLEALQQSMNYLESDTVSDFAHLSSTLNHDTTITSIPEISTKPEQSMLKKLLLCPVNTNYPKEVDSPNSEVPQSIKVIKKPLKGTKVKKNSRLKQKKKPFVELLKHLEASESTDPNLKKVDVKSGTKIINTKGYQKRYGAKSNTRKLSAPSSRASSPSPFMNEFVSKSSSSSEAIKDSIIKADEGVADNSNCSSIDHNYCSSSSNSPATSSQSAETVQQAPISNSTRVLKWQDYLHQVRAGIRSAPNSPTTSPKVTRGSALNKTNFMVHGSKAKATIPQPQVPKLCTPKPKIIKPKTVLTAQDLIEMVKNKGSKSNAKLLEFDEYMAKLQKNLNGSAPRVVILPNKMSAAAKNKVQSLPVKIPLTASETTNNDSISNSLVTQIAKVSVPVGQVTSTALQTGPTKINTHPKMVMVKLPSVTVLNKNPQEKANIAQPALAKDANNNKITDPRLLIKTNFVPKQDLKIPQMAYKAKLNESRKPVELKKIATQTTTANTVCGTTALSSQPTFKLVTSGKDAPGGKSLILSGVTGQLRDILLTLAKQQHKDITKTKLEEKGCDDQQQKTLQQLISAISKLNAPVSKAEPHLKTQNTSKTVTTTAVKTPTRVAAVEVKPPVVKPAVKIIKQNEIVSTSAPVTMYPRPSVLSSVTHGNSGSTLQPAELMNNSPTNSTKSSTTIKVEEASLPESIDSISSEIVIDSPMQVPSQSTDICNGDLQSNLVSSTSVEEVITQPPPQVTVIEEPSQSHVKIDEKEDQGISLEDAVASFEDEGLLSSCDESELLPQPGSSLYSKLPSYLTTGRLPSADNDGTTVVTQQLQEKDSSSFDKLPHYFSSGKTQKECVEVGVKQPTEEQDEMFYSRLPSYYGYGRPHPNVKTFNDDSEQIDMDDSSHKKSRKRKKGKSKKKTKHQKNKKSKQSEISEDENMMFSKIPSYCMSGKLDVESNYKQAIKRKRSPSLSSLSSRSRSLSRSRSRSYSSSSDRRYSQSSSSYYTSTSSDSDSRYGRSNRKSYKRKSRRERDSYRKPNRKYARYSDSDKVDSKQQRAMEERRVVYVGRITRNTTKTQLRMRFQKFGEIVTITLHFRENSDNYGFITYMYTSDAFKAIEEGNMNLKSGEPHYQLCFGGRRQFCKVAYADLDNAPNTLSHDRFNNQKDEEDDFDALLKMAKRGRS